jgi:ubiquinone/menaquinone biosynthesis C-methylase UbiE
MDIIKDHYIKSAKEFGKSKEMSMQDIFTKDAEIKDIVNVIDYFTYKKYCKNILEVGCGNGYTADILYNSLDINYNGIDFCEDLVNLSKERNIDNYIFSLGDVCNLNFENNTFDLVFSERCLINLDSWDKQQKGLSEIYRVLKKGGIYIMIEGFTDGLNNLNEARRVVGLEPIKQKFFNKYFDKEKLMDCIKDKFIIYDEKDLKFTTLHKSNFLSTYYFGRSVLYPALVSNKNLEYNNKFVDFFSYMEPYGNYSYIQSLVFERV